MPTAEELAKSLAAKFLENGNYEAFGALSHSVVAEYPQAAAAADLEEYFREEAGFSGLAVHSVGCTMGLEADEVIVYVTKGSRRALESIPDEIDGIPIEAKVMGKLKAGSPTAAGGLSNFYERNGRIACGSSCAPSAQNYAGTFGCLIRKNGQLMALSNNHVFGACNHTPVDMPILSPSTMDAKPGRRAPTEICRHAEIVELRSGDPALVNMMRLDAAIARVPDVALLSSWQGDGIAGYDTPAQHTPPISGMRVKKFGRTTGLTSGTVEAFVPTPWPLPYKSTKFTATVWFTDTWTVLGDNGDPFALPGDSGSVIVTEDNSAVVGLLFAVNNKGQYGIIMPIDLVLGAFGGATLVSGHGI